MNADRFAEIERLYHEAMIRRPEERAAFLDQACGNDDALRREVQSLLSLQTGADDFLSRPAIEEAARSSQRSWEPDSWPTIPGYTVVRVLGEGGMGVVYLAEQERPFRRLVALKLIKPGMDTRQVVARFETERQALALMDHPNIAAVFDAGSTEEGRPYFVMEFVDGVAITDYCDRGRLSTRDRLALFVQVCAAVQHAHQKGVIHRDLKPSNVLVSERDGRALPKVIDFGTAKAVGGTWNATATQGGQGMVLGTLEYMSPEQAALSGDIDTATDVYSLGVLLYELLVGRLPFDTDELRAAGYDEIRRVIRESEPPKPSVRAEQQSDKSGPAARARQTDMPGLTRQLRGDLDWITLKALEKDRRRRYATVAALATDIGRFLGDQPVEARPPSSTYRIRKFTRRHRGAVIGVAAVIVALVAGLAASFTQYVRAEGQRLEAERQRQQATEQREQALTQRSAADRAATEANEQRANAVAAQADAEAQRQKTMRSAVTLSAALQESTYLFYTATLAAAAGDLRAGAASEARARLLAVPEAQRGWEWRHLFIQTDESAFSLAGADPVCGMLPLDSLFKTRPAVNIDAGGESVVLLKCLTLERWSMPNLAHSAWTAPPKSLKIMAANSRGQMLTLPELAGRGPWHLVLTGRAQPPAVVTFGPFPFEHVPICADISPDGAHIAVGVASIRAAATTADVDDVFEVWNASTGKLEVTLIATPPALRDTRGPAYCAIQFSPDGRRIATSGARVQVWDTATGAEQAADSKQAGTFSQAIAFSRDGDRLAIGRSNGLVDILILGNAPPNLLRMSGNGLVAEESIPETDRMVQTVLRRKREVLALAFSPDGQTVVTGTSTTVGVWDIGQSKLVRVLSGHAADVLGVAVSSDGNRVYSVDAAAAVRVWPLRSTPAVVRTPGSFANFLPIKTSADGNVIATSTTDGAIATLRLTDMHQEVILAGKGESSAKPSLHPLVALSPDGQQWFDHEEAGSIRRRTIGSNEAVVVATVPILNCKYSPPDAFVAIAGVSEATVSPSGALLAYADANCVAVWDMATKKQLAVFFDENSSPTHVLFRDEQTLIISSQDLYQEAPSVVRIWNWQTNRVLATAEPKLTTVAPKPSFGPRPGQWRIALSPDGRRIALIPNGHGMPTTVSIWDSGLKAELGRLPSGDYEALAFSPDGRRIATVGFEESVVRIWDAERLLPLLALTDTDSHMGGVAFTRAGQIVAGRTLGGLTIWESQIRQR